MKSNWSYSATNLKKITIDEMKILYEHSISGELF